MSIFSGTDLDNVRNMLFDADAGGDILLFIRSLTVYVILRLICELAIPGKIKGYTKQQYVMTIFHQAAVLPICLLGWLCGVWTEGQAPVLIYVLTGSHMISDSIVNYTPVSACVAGADGRPVFSWGVHAHHLFTVVLCAIGTTLPPWPVTEGAICIVLGELGSLWITITMLKPTPTNFAIRFFTFTVSRTFSFLIALDVLRQVHSFVTRALMLGMMVGLCIDNWGTLIAMADSRKRSRYAAGNEESSLKDS
ncbi:hypothetical protein AB1Y20_020269 [Prymnesium parvum]|uniref:TLC domain-containing protein n=1 Tax=Prymnesium parvum TaxID=97485 RepID=A0AB34JUQ8_PRYPA